MKNAALYGRLSHGINLTTVSRLLWSWV